MTNRRLPINGIFRVGEITEASDITRFRLQAFNYWQVPPATANREKPLARNEKHLSPEVKNSFQEITFEYQLVIEKVESIREPPVFGGAPP